jgi:hypothetical protein
MASARLTLALPARWVLNDQTSQVEEWAEYTQLLYQ